MEYVYEQQSKPTNATGVPVSIDVLDSNNNYRNIGTTTSDASGMFTFTWTPDIQSSYTVYAIFDGSKSYWPSSSETSFSVDAAAQTPPPIDKYVIPAHRDIHLRHRNCNDHSHSRIYADTLQKTNLKPAKGKTIISLFISLLAKK